MAAEESNSNEGSFAGEQDYIDSGYQIQLEAEIRELSSRSAKAYQATSAKDAAGSIYALVFENSFAVQTDVISALSEIDCPNLCRILDYGKTVLKTTKSEKYAVILEKPKGAPVSKIFETETDVSEDFISDVFVIQILSAMKALSDEHIMHGSINLDKIFFDEESKKFILTECISDYCGYSQKPAYESIDQMICDPAGKGDDDIPADYFAMGIVVLFLLTGQEPFKDMTRDDLLDLRFKDGSQDSAIAYLQSVPGTFASTRIVNLIKGVLTDHPEERWGAKHIDLWVKKREMSFSDSRLHKQATTEFEFDSKTYLSKKHLVHDLYRKWSVAKKDIDMPELSRWMGVGVKQPHISEKIDSLRGRGEVSLTNEKLARLIYYMDPEGPIRFQSASCNIFGIGSHLANSYMESDKEKIRALMAIIDNSIIDGWISYQSDPSDYNRAVLGWNPPTIKQYVRNKTMGFGDERCLYELNRNLPCQSSVLGGDYVSNLQGLMTGMEKNSGGGSMKDGGIDRHISAFISSKLGLTERVTIVRLQNFPKYAREPAILSLGLLTMAQKNSGVKNVPNLASSINDGLLELAGDLHSDAIRKSLKTKLNAAAKEGSLSKIFSVITSPNFIRSDTYGYREARMQYRALSQQIMRLQSVANMRRMAYHYGLRISVTIAYIVFIAALLFSMFRSV